MTNRHASKLSRAQRRDLNKKSRLLQQTKKRRMEHEALEDRHVLSAAAPTLVGIQPNSGELLQENDVRGISPRSLTFNFAEAADSGDLLDSTTLADGIVITRAGLDGQIGTADDVLITGPGSNFQGFIGIGDQPNQVVVRFGEALPDDLYRIEITSALTDIDGDAANSFVRNFELNLAPQVMSVVPQPIERDDTTGELTMHKNQIYVYFNDDDLDPSLANNPDYYQLSFQQPGTDNTDSSLGLQNGELAFYPTSVSYDATLDRSVLTFADDIDKLVDSSVADSSAATVFRLQVGLRGIASKSSQILDLTVGGATQPGTSFDTAYNLSDSSDPLQSPDGVENYTNANLFDGNPEFLATQGANATLDGTTFTINDGTNFETFELSMDANPTTVGNIVINMSLIGTTSTELAQAIRSAINTSGLNVEASTVTGFSPARTKLRGTVQNRVSMTAGVQSTGIIIDQTQSLIIRNEIQNTTPYDLTYPGSNDEPGHRDIEIQGEVHLNTTTETSGIGVTTFTYNFPDVYGNDPANTSSQLHNQITDTQKERAREIFEIYGFYAGVKFVEVPSDVVADFGIVTGDLRAVDPTIITGVGGVAGIAGSSNTGLNLAIMELADHNQPGDDEVGAVWQTTAFHEIGHLLGLGHAYDLPPGTIMGSDGRLAFNQTSESLLPGDFDINHLQYIYRPVVTDIDMYRFDVTETGTLSAEIIAERLADSSSLDSALTLYRLNGDGSYTAIARNDNYYSNDSFLSQTLEPGTYFVGVSASGNNVYDPVIEDSGIGGTSQGKYDLQLRFTPTLNESLRDTGASVKQLTTMLVLTGGSGFTDGETITLSDGQQSQVFEFDIPANASDPITLNDPNAVAIRILSTSLQSEVVAAIIDAINGANFDVVATNTGNRIELQNLGGASPINLSAGIIQDQAIKVTAGVSAGAALDGDLDGVAGGNFNFWFRAEPTQDASLAATTPRTFIVDGTYTGTTQTGSLTQPFSTIAAAISAADAAGRGDVIRIVGLQQNDNDPDTLSDDNAYLIGPDPFNAGQNLKDGRNIILPKGVTMMIDAGAILKFSNSSIQVGSTSVSDDRSFSALQILGIPERFSAYTDSNGTLLEDTARKNQRVTLTSYRETTLLNDKTDGAEMVGTASNTQLDAEAGNWGGILFSQQVDRQQGRGTFEDAGIFLDSVIGADFRYAGGIVNVNGASRSLAPVYMDEARPTINYNKIRLSAGAALSADPNSFQESDYAVYNGAPSTFTSDIERVGPDIFGNHIVENSTNGILVRIKPSPASAVEKMTVAGRFDDTDIVYVIQDALYIDSTPGGPYSDDVDQFKVEHLQGIQVGNYIAVNAVSTQGQTVQLIITFNAVDNPLDKYDIVLSDYTTEEALAQKIAELINQFRVDTLLSGLPGPVLDVNATAVGDVVKVTGNHTKFAVVSGNGIVVDKVYDARLDASLIVDPNVVVKFNGGRIEVGNSANFIAEGAPGRPVVFTSLADDRYGFGGTFDTNNDGTGSAAAPGDWSGIYFANTSTGSIDNAVIAYAGGDSNVAGGQAFFNPIEIQQANVRITDSTFEYNANGSGSGGAGGATRAGHLTNGDAVIFVRGAQPVIVGNNFRFNDAAVLNVDTSSLNYQLVVDWGRSTGDIDLLKGLGDNQGALIRRNLLTDNSTNGMIVRGGTLTTQSVWDDTDIVHVLTSTIYSTNFHTYGGIRLESSNTESLVVKLMGSDAGFVATGEQLDITDRIGGMLQVIGQPGYPVVFTSLADDTVGAGFNQYGQPQNDTNNDGNATNPIPGQWKGLTIDEFANDRNVQVVVESEQNNLTGAGINGTPQTSQDLGALASDELSGDDNNRLGFEVNGYLSNPSDVDVYRFVANPGTEVWFDIDRTTYSLDTVVELVDGNGNVIAASSNSANNTFYGQAAALQATNPLQKSGFYTGDFMTTNPRDAGFRVVLPGDAGEQTEYHVRVRSNTSDLSSVNGAVNPGLTSGVYQLNIRLRETDEVAGSTIQYADVRYATNGISIYGQPGHSPLLGESSETTGNNDTIGQAQDLGNVLNSDRGAISVGGSITDQEGTNVDWYQVQLNFDDTQQISGKTSSNTYASLIFDMDYTAGTDNLNSIISIYDSSGRLVFVGDRSNINNDQSHPSSPGPDGQYDLSRGSAGTGDPFVGSVMLPAGTPDAPVTYYVAVSSQGELPTAMDQFFKASASDADVRFEPIDSVYRIVEDHINSGDYTTPTAPGTTHVIDDTGTKDYSLADLNMFLISNNSSSTANLWQYDPFTGALVTLVGNLGSVGSAVGDFAMSPDGTLYAYGLDNSGNPSDANAGNFFSINTGTGAITPISDDNIGTYMPDGKGNAVLDHLQNVTDINSGIGWGYRYLGTAFDNSSGSANGLDLYVVGNRGNATSPVDDNSNVIFLMDGYGANIGTVANTLNANQLKAAINLGVIGGSNAGSKGLVGRVDTSYGGTGAGNAIQVVRATTFDANNPIVANLQDGMTFIVNGNTYELELGNEFAFNINQANGLYIKDGESFQIQNTTDNGTQDVVFDTGQVINLASWAPGSMADGNKLQIKDANGVTATFVFDEINNLNDQSQYVGLGSNEYRVIYNTSSSASNITQALTDAINSVAGFGVSADNTISNRITLTGDSTSQTLSFTDPGNQGGIVIEGDYGPATDSSQIVVPVEETMSGLEITQAIQAAFAAANNSGDSTVQMSVNNDANGVANNLRFNFIDSNGNALDVSTNAAIDNLLNSKFTSSFGYGAGNVPVVIGAGYTAVDVSNAIVNVLNNNGESASNIAGGIATGTVTIADDNLGNAATVDVTSGALDPPFSVGGSASGGYITGITYVGGEMYAVTNQGGLFHVTNGSGGFDYLPGSGYIDAHFLGNYTDSNGVAANFTGLSTGPSQTGDIDPAIGQTLFAVTSGGDILALDTNGEAQHLFQGGKSIISTGQSGVQGIQFGTLTRNLWHTQSTLENDYNGHGIDIPVDNSRLSQSIGTDGNNSTIYFGNQNQTYGSGNTTSGNATQNDYNFPGGAHGSIISNPFSLVGYDAADAPMLYYNYKLETGSGDSFTVYASTDDGEWVQIGGGFANQGWRQARIDMSQFAGEANIRLRFDFTTGGDLNYQGELNGLSVRTREIRALQGSDLLDGGSFSVTDQIGGGTTTFEIEKGQSYSFDSGARIYDSSRSSTDAFPNIFSLTDLNANSVIYEYVAPGAVLSDPTHVGIYFEQTDTAAQITEKTRAAIRSSILSGDLVGVTMYSESDNSFNIQGVVDVSQANLPVGMYVTGDTGVNGTNIPIEINSQTTAVQVATLIQQLLNENMAPDANDQNYMVFDRWGQIVYLTGYDVNIGDSGLGYDGVVGPGDSLVSLHPVATAPGLDNLHTGVFIDDIIVGFAERGEMVTNANAGLTSFTRNPSLPLGIPNTEILNGTYQLEIRRGTDYGSPQDSNPGLPPLILNTSFRFDTNDRLDQGYSLYASAGANISTGERIVVSDGVNRLTFEFYDIESATEQFKRGSSSTIAYDTAQGIYSIPFHAGDTSAYIATLLANAINDHAGQIQRGLLTSTVGEFGVVAQLNIKSGTTTSNRVDLSAASSTDSVIVENNIRSDDSIGQAFDLVTNPDLLVNAGDYASRTVIGTIGDNNAHDQLAGIADIDVYRFNMTAGQQVSFNLATFLNNTSGLGATLKLFLGNVIVPGFPDQDGTGVEQTLIAGGSPGMYSFTATQDGTYYVVVAANKVPTTTPPQDLPLNYNANLRPDKDPGRFATTYTGDYALQINLSVDGTTTNNVSSGAYDRSTGGSYAEGSTTSSFLTRRYDTLGGFTLTGDSNRFRDQGQIIIKSNMISNSANFGILIDAGLRNDDYDTASAGNRPHQGAPINFPNSLNTTRLATGVTITNNVIYNLSGTDNSGAIHYSGDGTTAPLGAVPFGRIINNTLYGSGNGDVGVLIDNAAGPTLLNNIVANFGTGVQVVDATSRANTVLTTTAYQDNGTNTNGVQTETGAVVLATGDPLFVDAANGNFYLEQGSVVIDAATLEVFERASMNSLLEALGSEGSNIFAPARDITGQLRSDDYSSATASGIGGNPVLDIGAYDRSDITGPTAYLIDPQDNDAANRDLDAKPNQVQWITGPLTNISIQLLDQGQSSDQVEGTGIDDASVTAASVTIETLTGTNPRVLTLGTDYTFSYDATNNIIRLVSVSGVFEEGVVYKVTLVSDPNATGVIKDLAGNTIEYNNQYLDDQGVLTPETRFLIQVGGLIDFGDAPDTYGTLLASDGARHTLVPDFYLGSTVDAELDGKPTADASGDGSTDDGIHVRTADPANPGQYLVNTLRAGVNNELYVTATNPNGSTTHGFLDAWIDFNHNGVFDEATEHVLQSVTIDASALDFNSTPGVDPIQSGQKWGQLITITDSMIPTDAVEGPTIARFRYSSTGGLMATGSAPDGEVEDYQINIAAASVNPWHNYTTPAAISLGDQLILGNDLSIMRTELFSTPYTPGGDGKGRYYTLSTGDFRDTSNSFDGKDYRPDYVAISDVVAYYDVNNDRKVTNADFLKMLDELANLVANSPEPIEGASMLADTTPIDASSPIVVNSVEITSPVADSPTTTSSLAPVVSSAPISSSSLSTSSIATASLLGTSSMDAIAPSYSDLQMKPATEQLGLQVSSPSQSSTIDSSLIDSAIALDEISDDQQFDALLGDLADEMSSNWDGKQFGDDADESLESNDLDELVSLISDSAGN